MFYKLKCLHIKIFKHSRKQLRKYIILITIFTIYLTFNFPKLHLKNEEKIY